MLVTREMNAGDFEFWGGAVGRVKYLSSEELETIWEQLEECFPDGMDETSINDFFWFEDDTVAEWLGYNNFDEIMEREN